MFAKTTSKFHGEKWFSIVSILGEMECYPEVTFYGEICLSVRCHFTVKSFYKVQRNWHFHVCIGMYQQPVGQGRLTVTISMAKFVKICSKLSKIA